MLIDGLGLCGLLWCCFISCLDSHSDGTHSLHRIHWWVSDVMLNFSKYVLLKKTNSSWMYWERVNCQQMLISGWTIRLTAKFWVSAEVWLQRRVEFLPYLMILLHAAQSGVQPLESAGFCCAACMMELRFCMGVGWTGFWCCVTTVLVLSGW